MNARPGNGIIKWNLADIRLGVTMDFYKKYELIEMFRDDGIKSFRAKEIATGRFVEVHLLIGSSPLNRALQRKVDELPPDRKRQVLDKGEHEGTIYTVTEPFPWTVTFRDWVTSAPGPAAPSEPIESSAAKPNLRGAWKVPPSPEATLVMPEPPVSSTPPQSPPGSFTEQFQASPGGSGAPGSPPAAGSFTQQFHAVMQGEQGLGSAPVDPQPPAGTDQLPSGLPQPEEDEPTFTQLFRIPPAPAAKTVSSTPLPGSGTDTEQPSFTGLFRTPVQPAPIESAPATPATAEPPPFTQMFRTPALGEQKAEPVIPAQPAPPSVHQTLKTPPLNEQRPEPVPPSAPAEPVPPSFTQMFKVPQPVDNNPAAAPGKAHGSGNEALTFTQMFKAPEPGGAPSSGRVGETFPPRAPSATGSPSPPQTAPAGEFTRMFQAPVPPKPMSEPTAAPPPAPPSSTPSPSGTGEFTSFFQSPMAAKPMKESHIGAEPPRNLQPPPPRQGPGEFTRIFGKNDVPPPPAGQSAPVFGQTPVPSPPPFEPARTATPFGQPLNPFGTAPSQPSHPPPAPFTPPQAPFGQSASPLGVSAPPAYSGQPFSTPMSATGAFSLPQSSAPASPAAPARSGPGEYTRVFATPAPSIRQPQPQPNAQVPAVPPAAGIKPPSKLLPFLVLGGILLLAIIIVAAFALMRN